MWIFLWPIVLKNLPENKTIPISPYAFELLPPKKLVNIINSLTQMAAFNREIFSDPHINLMVYVGLIVASNNPSEEISNWANNLDVFKTKLKGVKKLIKHAWPLFINQFEIFLRKSLESANRQQAEHIRRVAVQFSAEVAGNNKETFLNLAHAALEKYTALRHAELHQHGLFNQSSPHVNQETADKPNNKRKHGK